MLGERLALDVESDAVHALDELAYELVGAWSEAEGRFLPGEAARIRHEYGDSQTREAMGEIEGLVASGQLFTPAQSGLEPGGPPVFKSLCLHMAHDCNMRCAYCFASAGSFGSERSLMPAATAKQAVDFVAGASGARRNIEIDFFGGEPLLNFAAIKETVEHARAIEHGAGKRFRFTLTTNGLLLAGEAARFANEHMDNLVLSADGRPQVHDAMRKSLAGGGTYAKVVPRLKAAVAARGGKSYYVRGTYTSRNKDFASDVAHLAGLGFSHISVEPAAAPCDPALEFAPEDLGGLLSEYERLASLVRASRLKGRKPINFFHFRLDLDDGPCRARRLKGCGAGFEYAAVAPDGGIYPCHQFAGQPAFRLGDVWSGVTDVGIRDAFREAGGIGKQPCAGCWAKYFCGGGCAANAWHYSHDIAKPNAFYCELQKKRLECAIWLLVNY